MLRYVLWTVLLGVLVNCVLYSYIFISLGKPERNLYLGVQLQQTILLSGTKNKTNSSKRMENKKFTPRELINRFIRFPDQPITGPEIGSLILRSAVDDILSPLTSRLSTTPSENKEAVKHRKRKE